MTGDDDKARLDAWFEAQVDADDLDGNVPRRPFDDASVPVGGALWRAVGGASAFWWSAVGCAVLLVGWVVGVGGVVIAAARGGNAPDSADGLAMVGWFGVVVGGLVVMSLVWVAELGRRGRVVRARRRATLLPRGTNVSQVVPLGAGWHLAWLAACVMLTVLFVWVGFDGAWFGDDRDGGFGLLWAMCALVTSFVSGVVFGSFVKKQREIARRRRAARADAAGPRTTGRRVRPSAFWRWFVYRWRLDLWLCGLGALGTTVAVAVHRLVSSAPPDDPMTAGDWRDAHQVVTWTGSLGVAVLAVGVWCGTQFWRSGESIDSAESVS